MDSSPTFDIPRDEAAAKNRFENFKLGKGLPSSAPLGGPKHGHARSHSRTASISSSLSSFSFSAPSKPTSVNDMSHFSFPPSNTPSAASTSSPLDVLNPNSNPIPPSKRNSHHRRRSSVSTRHESAELMGVSLPDLPLSTSDDNINLGEKDSIRRRALWALEGKPDVSYSKVEIPDISTPDIEKMMFDFSTKPSLCAGSTSGYANGLNKRDSFKLLGASSSSKDQLHTLVEEEEEEEEESVESSKAEDSLPSPAHSIKENVPPLNTPITLTPVVAVTKPTPAKPRPSNLNLRPLSLTPDNLITASQGLPTPTLTPSPRTGLRSLSLTPSPAPSDDSMSNYSVKQSRRASLIISPTPAGRKPVLNLVTEQVDNSFSPSNCEDSQKPIRRSSISYKRSSSQGGVNIAGLPTPEMTPTFGRRHSNAESLGNTSTDDEVFPNPPTQSRPLSASEQHFLFKSHNALLARITDLERALSMRRRESGGYSNGGNSRPMSVASSFSSSSDMGSASALSEPTDEMLNLIADLKAERDELKRDVDGWRTRVSNLETQTGVLAKRVENERRDAWVARSRVGLLEVEKGVLTKKLEAIDELIELHEKEKSLWEAEKRALKKENDACNRRVTELELELERVKKELEAERLKKVKEESDPLATPTPRSFDNYKHSGLNKKHGLGFMSIDSESSATEFDPDSSDEGQHAFGFVLKSVQESDEADEEDYSEEENGLAGYEDEEDTDMSLQSSSSFESDDDIPRSAGHLQHAGRSSPSTPTRPVFTPPRPTHVSRPTLSKTWTFPKGAPPPTSVPQEDDKDRFFGCLDDDSDTSGSVPNSPSAYSYEKSKNMFSSGFKFAPEDDNASFFLPDDVGVPADNVDEKDEKRLSVVAEEDEEEEEESESEVENDDDMFGEIGGIRITFTPPQEEEVKEERKQIQISPVKRTSPPPTLPALDFGGFDNQDDQEDIPSVIPFNFGRSLKDEREPSTPPVVASLIITRPSSIPRPTSPSARSTSPSMIPRPASPSSIPRPTISRPSFSATSTFEPTSTTPPKISPMRAVAASSNFSSSSFITPPNKRGGALPSFIPQSVSSPSPMRSIPAPTKPKVIPTSTFIRQPPRRPLLSSAIAKGQSGTYVPSMNAAMNTRSFRRSCDNHAAIPAASFDSVIDNNFSSAQMKSIDLSHGYTRPDPAHQYPQADSRSSVSSTASSVSSIMSSPLAARLSFQTFTNFIPLPWAPRASAAPPSFPSSSESHSASSSISDHTVVAAEVVPRKIGGYVSREKQLRMLKARMEVEGMVPMRTCVNVQCKKCDGELVFI